MTGQVLPGPQGLESQQWFVDRQHARTRVGIERLSANVLSRGTTMRYLLAIVLPPLAIFLCGKPIQFLLNIPLTLLFWIPGVLHALLVVHSHLADKRTERVVRAIRGSH